MNQAPLWLGWWAHADVVVRGVFVVLVFASVASWSVALLKFWQLMQWREKETQVAQRLHRNELPEANDAIAPTCRLLREAEHLRQARPVDADMLLTRLDDTQALLRLEQERGMTVLATVGSAAPFVGLLGTVWGIMHALQTLKGAEVSLETVAGPVGEALIATAIGLFAAIPALIAYNFLVRGLRSLNALTSHNARRLVDVLYREG